MSTVCPNLEECSFRDVTVQWSDVSTSSSVKGCSIQLCIQVHSLFLPKTLPLGLHVPIYFGILMGFTDNICLLSETFIDKYCTVHKSAIVQPIHA